MIASGIHYNHRQRLTAALALLAMLLLFVGPVISQVHAYEQPDITKQQEAMADCRMENMPQPDHVHKNALQHWFDQCGYCSLWQHFPTADLAGFTNISGSLPPAIAVRTFIAAPIQALAYSSAQPRAPPVIS